MRVLSIICISLFMSCAPARFVEPLDKGDLAIGVSLGGPTIDFGGPLPLPLSSIEVGYGIDSTLTVHGGWHTTAAAFGNAQIDAGITYQFLEQKKARPSLSISPAFNFIYNFDSGDARIWPIIDVNAFWNYGKRRNYFYAGLNNYIEPMEFKALDQIQTDRWILSPQIGHVFKGKKRPWRITTEFKFIAPYKNNVNAFVPYKSIFGEWGASSIYVGFSYPISLKK